MTALHVLWKATVEVFIINTGTTLLTIDVAPMKARQRRGRRRRTALGITNANRVLVGRLLFARRLSSE